MKLPALVSARDVRALLGVSSNAEWDKLRKANPAIAHVVPGMARPKYVKERVLALLPQ